MRRFILLLALMAVMLVLVSGVALAVNKIGTNSPDTLIGTNKSDNLLGLGGNDMFDGGLGGNDNLIGGPGRDFIHGGLGGNDNLLGGPGNDAVNGGLGSDNVVGNKGNDLLVDVESRGFSKNKLLGGDGNDVIQTINGPAVKDVVMCGDGLDRVLADRKDVIAPDCEKVFVGNRSGAAFINSIPRSFWEGLPQG